MLFIGKFSVVYNFFFKIKKKLNNFKPVNTTKINNFTLFIKKY